jgi:hypothetical protein
MAFQCKSRFIPDSQGRIQMKVIDGDDTIVLEIDEDDIREDSVLIEPEPLDNIYSEIFIWYGLRTGAAADSQESYQGLVYATPEDTTPPERALDIACEVARVTLRRDRHWNILADFIRDEGTAHKLLEFLVGRHTIQRDLVTFEMPYYATGVELGDQIALRHRLLNNDDPLRAEVLAWEYDGSRAGGVYRHRGGLGVARPGPRGLGPHRGLGELIQPPVERLAELDEHAEDVGEDIGLRVLFLLRGAAQRPTKGIRRHAKKQCRQMVSTPARAAEGCRACSAWPQCGHRWGKAHSIGPPWRQMIVAQALEGKRCFT